MRKVTVGTIVMAGALSLAAPAWAATDDGRYAGAITTTGSVSASVVIIGQTVNVYGGGFLPGATVVINNNDRPVGTVPANTHGDFAFTVTVDACGTNTLTGMGTGPNGSVSVSSTVLGSCPAGATAGTTTGTSAADTGPSVLGTAITGTTPAAGTVTSAGTPTSVLGATTGTTAAGGTASTSGTTSASGTSTGTGTTASAATTTKPSTSTLARTGSDVALLGLVVGLGLVVAGAGAVVVTRRRRTSGAA